MVWYGMYEDEVSVSGIWAGRLSGLGETSSACNAIEEGTSRESSV
jgi:hypothetical protein